MKISFNDPDRLARAVLRNCATRYRLPRTCAIRKCRRDGACTGPLLRYDEAGRRFCLAAADGSDAIAPLCYIMLDHGWRDVLSKTQAGIIERIAHRPGIVVPEKTRTIAARRWRSFSIPAAVPDADDPPPAPQHGDADTGPA